MSGVKAPFSFHCTICFESLNLTDRAPVVLPCGHTYICEVCAARLDKCMECRTPLRIEVQRGETITVDRSFRRQESRPRANTLRSSLSTRNSSGLQAQMQQARATTETIRLPTPRNNVLMCLIEATQNSSVSHNDDNRDGYESGDDDELVMQGLRVMGSSSGTYVVREKNGLKVHPMKKKSKSEPGTNELSVVNFFKKVTLDIPEEEEEYMLKYGQTVQIFLFENGIATVARGAGFILVDNSSQLVKIGEVTDEACKLEAINMALSAQVEELQRKTSKILKAQASVKSSLHDAMEKSKNLSPFGPVPEDIEEPEEDFKVDSDDGIEQDYASFAEILQSKSYDERTVSALPKVAPLEPSLSFENFSTFERMHGNPNSGSNQNGFWYGFFQGNAESPRSQPHIQGPGLEELANGQSVKIDFASGLSGHSGLTSRRFHNAPQRQVMGYSHHRIY